MREVLTIKYTLNGDDTWTIGKFIHRWRYDSPAWKSATNAKLVVVTAAGVSVFATGIIAVVHHARDLFNAIVLLLSPVIFLVWPLYTRHRWRHLDRIEPWAFAERKLSLTSSDIEMATAQTTEILSWSQVADVSEDSKYIFLSLAGNQVICIPKRAFTKSTDADYFFTAAQNYRKQND